MTESVSCNTETEFPLPDEAIDVLQAYQAQSDTAQWALGDIVLALADELCKRRGDQQRLVRRVAIEATCDESTVRDRLNMAKFFEPATRGEYGLSFHQFRACKSAGPDDWRHYADWALDSAADYGGKPAPVSVIRSKIKADKNGDKDKPPRWVECLERIISLCDAIRRDSAPEAVKDAVGLAADRLTEHLPE
jgi:hypothetical protein